MTDSIKQYIDLYQQCAEAVNAHSCQPMNALRQQALAALEEAKMPRRGAEDYEATDLDAVFAPDYGVNVYRKPLPTNDREAFHCAVPGMSNKTFVVTGDVVNPSEVTFADGVVVCSLCDAAVKYPEIMARYYGSQASLELPQVALNTLLAQDGLLVYVPAGVSPEHTIQVVNLLNANVPMMAVRRMLVVVERGATAKLLVCDHTRSTAAKQLALQVVEVVVEEGATLDFYEMEESTSVSSRVSALYLTQKANSNVVVDGITLSNGTTRNDYFVNVAGEGCETQLLGMAIEGGEQHVDNHTFIAHRAPRCHSNELFKYVLDDNAVGAFSGKILVAEKCPRVESYQSNKNICAAPTAKMYTKPQLEIYTDDVKCSHGATIGQLDEEALFYMQARGIPRDEASKLLRQAFLQDVVEAVRLEPLRARLQSLVEKRFDGTLEHCATCAAPCPR